MSINFILSTTFLNRLYNNEIIYVGDKVFNIYQ